MCCCHSVRPNNGIRYRIVSRSKITFRSCTMLPHPSYIPSRPKEPGRQRPLKIEYSMKFDSSFSRRYSIYHPDAPKTFFRRLCCTRVLSQAFARPSLWPSIDKKLIGFACFLDWVLQQLTSEAILGTTLRYKTTSLAPSFYISENFFESIVAEKWC